MYAGLGGCILCLRGRASVPNLLRITGLTVNRFEHFANIINDQADFFQTSRTITIGMSDMSKRLRYEDVSAKLGFQR